MSIDNKFGRNPDIDPGSVPEDIWDGGGVYTGFPSAAETLSVVSTDAADTAAGTGARQVRVIGLDSNWNRASETITLNGLTPATGTTQFIRINTAAVVSVGSGGSNVGSITISHSTTTANVFNVIQPGTNQGMSSAYSVAAGQTAYLVKQTYTMRGATSANADMCLYSRVFGGPFRQRRTLAVFYGILITDSIVGGLPFGEKSDLVLRCLRMSTNNIEIAAGFDILLIKNLNG